MLWLVILVLAVAASSFAYPLLRRTYFTPVLVLANIALFLVVFLLVVFTTDPSARDALFQTIFQDLLFKPQDLLELRLQTLLTAMFLHLDPFHLIFNILILYLLGLPLEERIGGPAFGAIYLASGIAASLLYAVVQWPANTPALGASGAIMGIAGAFLALYPRERIFFLLGFFIVPRLPVYIAVGVTLAGEAVLLLLGVQDGVAHAAHMGGIGFGILLAPLIRARQREVPLPTLALADLATTEELHEILTRVQAESVGEVRDAWIDHFLEKAQCPQCQGPLTRRGKVVTSDCGWERRL